MSNTSTKIVVELGGKQHVTAVDEKFIASSINAKVGDILKAKDLLSGKEFNFKVLKSFLSEKIRGVKFHSKSRYTRRYGHRQSQVMLEVVVETKPKSEPKGEAKKTTPKKATSTKKVVAKKGTK